MLEVLWSNREWVFSGVGVPVLIWLVTVLRRRSREPRLVEQTQKGGMFSKNVQISQISIGDRGDGQ